MIGKSAVIFSIALGVFSFSITDVSVAEKVLRCPKIGVLQTGKLSKTCPVKKSAPKMAGTDGSHGGGGGGNGGGGGTRSDFRLKHNLIRVGTTVYGLPLYDFEYNFRPGTFEGVMAQDVLKVKPEAVSIGQDGFYRVNYDMLGIKMKRIR